MLMFSPILLLGLLFGMRHALEPIMSLRCRAFWPVSGNRVRRSAMG